MIRTSCSQVLIRSSHGPLAATHKATHLVISVQFGDIAVMREVVVINPYFLVGVEVVAVLRVAWVRRDLIFSR